MTLGRPDFKGTVSLKNSLNVTGGRGEGGEGAYSLGQGKPIYIFMNASPAG